MIQKRIILLLLSIAMLLPIFASCEKEKDIEIDSGRYDYDGSSREKAMDSIPTGYDLNNETISIWFHGAVDATLGNNETTDIVYSKIFERNLSVQERLNVKIDFLECPVTSWQDSSGELRREIQTMSAAFDAVFAGNNRLIQLQLFNYFLNLNDSNYIDITADWWYEDAIMELSVDNYNYRFLYGDIMINNLGTAGTIFYNKELYSQYVSSSKNPNEPYEKVIDGSWTLEEFDRLVKKSRVERGGDGTNDIYGVCFDYAEWTHFFRESAGIKLYERDAHGMPTFNFNNDNSISFLNQLYNLYFNNIGFANVLYDNQTCTAVFTDGSLVFKLATLQNVMDDTMREMKDDFGILPYPKLNEDQEEYITLIHNSSIATCIPVSTDEDRANEEVSAVIEALASESYRFVALAFYETALKTAYNRDDISAQMIDIITGQHDTVKSVLSKNFAYEYSNSLARIGIIFSNLMGSKSTNFASEYDSVIGPAETGMKTLLEQYIKGII